MQQTEHFQLNQWAASDRIQMEDFNSDNSKIEAALKSHADALAKCGNCKIVYGTYTGTGQAGSAHPNSLTFSGKPLLVIVKGHTVGNSYDVPLVAVRGSTEAITHIESSGSKNHLTWGTNSLSWYVNGQYDSEYQMNYSNSSYYYIALIAVDAT